MQGRDGTARRRAVASGALVLVVALGTAPDGVAARFEHPCALAEIERPAPAPAIAKAGARRRLRCLIAAVRAHHGLAGPRWNAQLAAAATRHARDMVRRRYFSHVSVDGRNLRRRVRRSGYLSATRAWWLGEVLAWGSQSRASPPAVVARWLRSRLHRRVLLNAGGREIGIGVALGSPDARSPARRSATFVVLLGSRRPGARATVSGARTPPTRRARAAAVPRG